MHDGGGEAALWGRIAHDASRLQKTENPSGLRQTGFVCPAWYLQAGADLALAVFFTRPQAEAQIGANGTIPCPVLAIKGCLVIRSRHAIRGPDRRPLRLLHRTVPGQDA